MTNVFAESLQTIGYWYAGSGDVMDKCFINLKAPSTTNPFPGSSLEGRELVLRDCNIRYYGLMGIPMFFPKVLKAVDGKYYLPPILGEKFTTDATNGFRLTAQFAPCTDSVINNEVTLTLKSGVISAGQHIVFVGKEIPVPMGNGQGQVKAVNGDKVTVQYVSKNIITLNGFTPYSYTKL